MRATTNEGTGVWPDRDAGSVNAVTCFYPTSGSHVSGGVVRSSVERCRNDNWIWACLAEPAPDDGASMINLMQEGVVRLGLTVGRTPSPEFEVTMATNRSTMEPSTYGFTAYAGDTEVTTVSGPRTVTTAYADVTVESAIITSGLSGKLNEAATEIKAPAKPYMRLTRVRMAVE